jgi:hypothetical protein
LLGPLPLAEPALDAALALAESLPYLGVHLKYLHAVGTGQRCDTLIPAEMPRYFQRFRLFYFSERS